MKLPSRAKLERDLARLKMEDRRRESLQQAEGGEDPMAQVARFFHEVFLQIKLDLAVFLSHFSSKGQTPRPKTKASSHDFACVLQVVADEPKFFSWFVHLKNLPVTQRNNQLVRMAKAMRIDPDNDEVAAVIDELRTPTVYDSFFQVLMEEKAASASS